ncbi:glutathione S-transferase family protein [Roseiterribacter gracilis]|uniref:Glutathione S-transferase n=1 Tax=Roseiterribacter gracilis TaxID=2812848 RepID=A0A8S8XGD6_9PROT|nr:glutathione S-transferase [Rhodospirillales bacterium TMPK1]
MSSLALVIGNKATSSWSLRPWIAMVHAGIPFREIQIRLRRSDTKAQIANWTASGKIPVLLDGGERIWESYAILEHLADRFPDRGLWPADPAARAHARSISCEMHGGFAALRRDLAMDVLHDLRGQRWSDEAQADIDRISAIWREARGRFGASGPFLFGRFSNADAMYAPVVTRFATYGVSLGVVERSYVDSVLAHPAMQRWIDEAKAEPPMGT